MMGLAEYANREAHALSRGNRRKLAVASAIIGDPKVVLLDSPSNGMDPVSRRWMWDVIANYVKNRCVIIATQSLEEVEALCHRVGIVVDGRLKMLGTTQHLKDMYGQGYRVE